MNRIYESEKLDIALVPQAVNDTNITGKYHPVKNYGRILALLAGGAMAATKTTKVELLQAVDNGGTDAKGIPTTVGQEAVAEITANALVYRGDYHPGNLPGRWDDHHQRLGVHGPCNGHHAGESGILDRRIRHAGCSGVVLMHQRCNLWCAGGESL